MRQELLKNTTKSLMQRKHDAIEIVSKKILNKFGYPNDIEVFTFQGNSNCHFVDVPTGETLAKVECYNFCVDIWISEKLNDS